MPDLNVTLQYGKLDEIPDLAVLLQSQAAPAGINIDAGRNGQRRVLRLPAVVRRRPPIRLRRCREFGFVDYGHRATPDVFLNSAFKSKGVWNSSHIPRRLSMRHSPNSRARAGVDAQKAACAKIETGHE